MIVALAVFALGPLQAVPFGGFEPEPASEAAIVESLDLLSQAWLSGQFEEVAFLAGDAVTLIHNSECPLREDVAIAAFMGAIANTGHPSAFPSRYLFWVADEVHTRVPSLPEDASELAGSRRGEPGGSVRTDRHFLETPYTNEALEAGCSEQRLEPSLLHASPEDASAVFAAFAFPENRARRYVQPERLIYAYPQEEGRDLAAVILERNDWTTVNTRNEVIWFDPCSGYPTRDLRSRQLCRGAAGREN